MGDANKMDATIACLDLDKAATNKVLDSAPWRARKRGGVEIFYKEKWLHLCRTDLLDDVRTWTTYASHGDPDSIDFYRGTVAYGARITDKAFFIVDSTSDG